MPDFSRLSQITRAAESSAERRRETEDRRFRSRVRGQRFLRDFAPLVAAGVETGEGRLGPEFERRVTEAVDLARLIALAVNGEEEGAKVAVQVAYRRQASHVVAQAWRRGVELDVASVAEGIGRGVVLSEGPEDGFSELSPEASLYVTMLPVRASLAEVAADYDFRMGVPEVTRVLVEAVRARAMQLEAGLAEGAASDSDRRTMVQTALRSFGSTMRAVYRAAAVEYVRRMAGMDESDKLRILDVERPVERVIARFHEMAAAYEGRMSLEMSDAPTHETSVPELESTDGESLQDGMHDRAVPPVI